METNSHICQHENHAEASQSGLQHALQRIWQIARDVLRGYLSGQPIDEERPRKGCC
ncbi:MAG TPA: hypothetical protein PLK30_02820 [Blastocatellia bacterium]|nr:hypothetical protein [Blastocatellia bacterium]